MLDIQISGKERDIAPGPLSHFWIENLMFVGLYQIENLIIRLGDS